MAAPRMYKQRILDACGEAPQLSVTQIQGAKQTTDSIFSPQWQTMTKASTQGHPSHLHDRLDDLNLSCADPLSVLDKKACQLAPVDSWTASRGGTMTPLGCSASNSKASGTLVNRAPALKDDQGFTSVPLLRRSFGRGNCAEASPSITRQVSSQVIQGVCQPPKLRQAGACDTCQPLPALLAVVSSPIVPPRKLAREPQAGALGVRVVLGSW